MQRLCGRLRPSSLRFSTPSLSKQLLRHPDPPPAPPDHRCVRSLSFFSIRARKTDEALPGGFLRWASLGSCRRARFATGFSPLQPKPLESIIDLERAKACSPEDLVSVWDDYHLGRGHIGASMKAKLYHLLEQRSMPHMLITGLEDYKARTTQASPYLTVTFYKDFAESKDVVLIRGDIVFTSKLSDSEAKWLIETVQSFYLNDTRYKLVERFNKETHEFEFRDVLQALEMPTA
ncbi:hypothetical protein Taro_046261 [Colocasia esculenta]|uniref:ATP synthase mitochondrial F1 complex assembly factor 1 n=1 Tax=Colocasia esculenta TaxID=4460 RepID=A0A843WYJ1_COLES|nr:hypothetical protein [Colocasia esculenta]